MNNQFAYTYEANGKKLFGSFNMDCVVRSAEVEPGQLLVILNDGHEEAQEKQVMEKGKPVMKRERTYVLSQIMLVGKDFERFKSILKYELPMELAPKTQTEIPFEG